MCGKDMARYQLFVSGGILLLTLTITVMTDGYIIQGKFNWGKEILYWSAIDSFHNGRNPKKGYTAYPTKAKANEVIRKLKKLYHEGSVTFEVLPDSEMPFIKRQKREWKRLFNRAARLVVSTKKSGAKYLMDNLSIRVDQAQILMKRLCTHQILGEPYCKKDEYFWQKEHNVPRRVKSISPGELEKKLRFIHKHKLL